jgi:hypothetical protein
VMLLLLLLLLLGGGGVTATGAAGESGGTKVVVGGGGDGRGWRRKSASGVKMCTLALVKQVKRVVTWVGRGLGLSGWRRSGSGA